jgi:predicted ATPase
MKETLNPPPSAQTLPSWGTSFVERDAELGRLDELLARPGCRLVTIFGPGGVGKTRLAAEFAHLRAGHLDWAFVELESHSDLETAIVQGMGLSAERPGDGGARIAANIGEDEFLLFLDNAEHLVDQTSLVDELLKRCPLLKVVVTSRHTLGLAAEWLLPLDGLEYAGGAGDGSPAAELFATRFEQASGRPIEQGEQELASRLCARLGGVPLAIELAAAWGSALTVAEILDELERDPGGLESGNRSVPERHRSVRAVFEHTWGLLSPAEQSNFVALSVFADGFDREAANKVAEVDLAALLALIGKSLVRADPAGRFAVHPRLGIRA